MVRKILGCLAALSISTTFVVESHAQNAPCLRIGSTFSHKHSVDDRVEQNLRTVLASLNICIDIVAGPPRRLTEALLRGDLDGELFRVREYGRAVEAAALLVEEPLSDVLGYFVAARDIDLARRPIETLKVGVLRGLKWHQTAAQSAGEVIVANDMEQLLSMLRNRRVDGIMIGGFLREEYPELSNLPAQVAYRSTAHFVLHRSHQDLARPIAAAIWDFKERGCSFTRPDGGSTCSDSGVLDEPLFQESRSGSSGATSLSLVPAAS